MSTNEKNPKQNNKQPPGTVAMAGEGSEEKDYWVTVRISICTGSQVPSPLRSLKTL